MSENKKTKILLIGDHPFAPSGVGTQLKYIIECLLKTGKYKFTCLGGAVKHDNYQPSQVPSQNGEWELGDWVIHPVDGYGNQELIRSAIWMDRPDMLMFMTDPRFYSWLWEMENEIRTQVPMVYYHVWDNYPYPKYNKKWYTSNDVIASISKVTYDIVNNVSPEVENHYIPHAVNSDIFKKLNEKDILEFKKESIGEENSNKFVFMWNNRNARRKQSGTLLFWFNEFAEEVGPENVCLIMHTDPTDPHGQPLEHIIKEHSATDGRIILSKNKVPPDILSKMYNMADCTINISDAEGFGLGTLESLSCGTPIIVNMTGGLQEQVTDGEEWFGIGIEPASKAIIGSQDVPYIYEDRINKEEFKAALHKMYNMPREEREELGKKGSEHVRRNYNFEDFNNRWISLVESIVENHGSWDSRKGYKTWEIKEIA
tara:strand:- start:2167 stop:3450 length:1284 start_codon:yes stop_codon:yes gene_type:complete